MSEHSNDESHLKHEVIRLVTEKVRALRYQHYLVISALNCVRKRTKYDKGSFLLRKFSFVNILYLVDSDCALDELSCKITDP